MPASPALCRPFTPPSPVALFLTGPAACGKTTLAQAWVRDRLARGEPWAILDKDVVGDVHGHRMLEMLGEDPGDRDSPVFKREVRDLDYRATLNLAAAQLELGGSVVLPGPWTNELRSGALTQPARLGLPPVRSVVVWLALTEDARRRRIIERGNPRDAWKLRNWDTYSKGAGGAMPQCEGPQPHVLDAELPHPELLRGLERIIRMEQVLCHS